MRKLIAIAFITFIALSSCSKSEPSTPKEENPVSSAQKNPPIQQNDPPVAYIPTIKDSFGIKKAEIEFIDELSNGYRVLLNLDTKKELPIFGQGFLYLEFDKSVQPETIQDIPRAQLINSLLLRIPLDSNTNSISIPATLTNINGTSLDREYSLSFKHVSEESLSSQLIACYPQDFPELKLEQATSYIINRGETFLLEQNWPLPRESFEKRVREAFSTAEFTMEWVDDTTLAVTIIASKSNWHGLELTGLEDTFGYKHESNCEYSFSLSHPKVIKSIELSTGRESVQNIPLAVSGATAMFAKDNVVKLYRRHPLAHFHDATDQHFLLDLGTGKVVGDIVTQSGNFSSSRQHALFSISPHLAPDEIYAYSALSPSATKWAVIYHNWTEDKSYLLLLDVSTETSERIPLLSQHPYDGGSYYLSPPIWSPDETKLIYTSLRDEGIYSFNMLTKKEDVIVEGNSSPLFYSPTGVLFIYSQGEYYMLSDIGVKTKLNTGEVSLRLVAWVDEDRALVSHDRWLKDDECYIYSIKANKLEFVSRGTAFDYDPLTGTVFILDSMVIE